MNQNVQFFFFNHVTKHKRERKNFRESINVNKKKMGPIDFGILSYFTKKKKKKKERIPSCETVYM